MAFTLGFEEKFAIRAFTRRGLDAGDHIILLTAKPAVDRVLRAYDMLRGFVERYYGGGVGVELAQIDVRDFPSAVAEIKTLLLKRLEGRDLLIVNLTGGLRALVLAAYTAALIVSDAAKELALEVEFEDGSYLVEVPKGIVNALKLLWSPSEERREVLRRIAARGEADAASLARELGLDPSTARRHIHRLEEEGLVEVVSRRPLVVRAKNVAKLIF